MKVMIHASTTADGSMKTHGADDTGALERRRAFLATRGVTPEDTVLVQVAYEGDDYRRYVTVGDADRGDGVTRAPSIVADALLTRQPDLALFLPLADCAPLVIYNEVSGWLMLSHLGRHSVEQDGARWSLQYFLDETGVPLADVRFWLGPAAGAASYPLWAFENKSLHEVILQQLADAGVTTAQIEVLPIDTTVDPAYYSHSNFLKGLQGDDDGRFAVVAVMR